MALPDIQSSFRATVSEKIELQPEGRSRYRVFTPFLFDDGDSLVIILKHSPTGWVLTDEGHTLMHLSYRIESDRLESGTRAELIDRSIDEFRISENSGELTLPIEGDNFGDALYDFVQALLRIADVARLTYEKVRSTFIEDVAKFLSEIVKPPILQRHWSDRERDMKGKYTVDFRVEAPAKPLFVYALQTESTVKDATIALLTFEKWGLRNRSIGIFEDQESIGGRTLSKFSDVVDRQFSNLEDNRPRIRSYVTSYVAGET